MRKMMTILFVLATAAQAQTWTVSGGFTDQFLGCQRTAGGTVECTITATYNGPLDSTNSMFYASVAKAITPDGMAISATASAVAGKPWDAYSTNQAYKGIAVKVVYSFPYPSALNVIALLVLDQGSIRNVAIAAPGAPAKGTATSAAPVQLGTTQAVVSGKAYSITLTNCKLNSGTYTCTSTLIPLH